MRSAIVLLTGATLGCAQATDGVLRARAGEALPDFTLVDTNATSATSGEAVSVSGQRGRVSAWYFGHST